MASQTGPNSVHSYDLPILFAGDSAADEAERFRGLKKLLTGRELGVALRERSVRGLRGMVQLKVKCN